MKLINADKVIEKLKEHKSLFCKNRDEFRALSDKDKARVDEIDTCIAELVNAEEFPTTEADTDTISRAKAIEALEKVARFFPYKIHGKPETYDRYNEAWNDAIGRAELEINELPPIQPDIVRCKDCQYWNSGSCEYPEHAVNCQDYMIGDIETEAEHFCGHAKRREVTT